MKLLKQLILFAVIFNMLSCAGDESVSIERPHSPFIFRSVLDSIPRMVTLGLHDDLWVSYSAERGALYKAWKGGVNFDGAVYTTAHGPQPSSLGNGWIEGIHEEPWRVMVNGQEEQPNVQYRGHQIEDGHATLSYELSLASGDVITVKEQPEYAETESGGVIFERTFTTENVPAGAEVVLLTNVNSVGLENSVKTDGNFTVSSKEDRKFKKWSGLDLDGKLVLNSNGTTSFNTHFVKQPLLENTNKIVGEEEEEDLPIGYRLIARNDCKTCHNTFVNTIGPSYKDVAKKYRNTEANVAMLVSKVVNGGSGVWGQTMMTAHPDLSQSDIKLMVEYIMELDAEEEAEMAAIEAAEAPEGTDFVDGASGLNEVDLFPGYVFKLYFHEKDLTKLADVETETPVYQGVLETINMKNGDLKDLPDNFAIVASGYIKIPKNNNYVFRLTSDDGARFTLDGEVIVDHDGLHGAEPRDGEVALSEGYHPFMVEYFQAGGGKHITLEWRSFNDGEFMTVPASAFAHHKDDAPDGGFAIGGGEKQPGDAAPLDGVHPSYDLTQARPDDFLPKVAGMDFMPDGRLAVSTWDAAGAVYLIDNVESGDPSQMTYTKVADGLAEPLGLKVVDGEIYVLQKQELTKLIDHDGDEIIDEYYTLCNDWSTTANFHEFAFGLEYKEGHFYGNLAIAILPGGASAFPQAPDRGKTFKISKETGDIEFIAQGLRTPNGIGLGVDDEIFIADNQGDWLPSSKILHITEGAFFNSFAVDPEGTKDLPVKQPVVWLPQDEIGNSPSTPLALNDGPYQGQMIHCEVTNGGVKRVFVEKVEGEYQGCVFRFTQGLEAGINRMAWGPDGGLYVGGVGSSGNWGHYGKLWYGLQRLKYNQKPAFEMLAVRAKANGVEVEFTEPLTEGTGWTPADYEVRQWWYKPTKEYGGPKMDEEDLTVRSATVSDDRKKVFLELDGLKEQHVVYLRLPNHWISDKGTALWTTEAWYTLNNIPTDEGIVKEAPPQKPNNSLSEAEAAAGWKLLFDGKSLDGWRNFKKESIGSSWQISDEAIMLDVVTDADGKRSAPDGGDIITDGQYENFELQLDWKIQSCGNSGIIYNVQEGDDYDYVWQTGPEMQVLDNACHPDAKIETHRAGDLYDMIACSFETVRPAGQWNQARLIINNGKVEHWLNGKKLVEFEMFNDEWTNMIANSKFKDMPGFGKFRKGHIALQDHDDRVWYRNIKIREL